MVVLSTASLALALVCGRRRIVRMVIFGALTGAGTAGGQAVVAAVISLIGNC